MANEQERRSGDSHILALRDQITRNGEAVQNLRLEVKEIGDSDAREHARLNDVNTEVQAVLANHGEQLSNIRTAVRTSGWWVASLISVIGVLVGAATYLAYDGFRFLYAKNVIQDARIEHIDRQADRNEARSAANEVKTIRNEQDIQQIDGRVRTLERKRNDK